MSRLGLLLFFSCGLAFVGCDSATEGQDCVYMEPGTGRQRHCAPAMFRVEDLRARETAGIVRRGADVVAGALVKVEASPLFADTGIGPTVTSTDLAGRFKFEGVALRYDMTVKMPTDVLLYRNVAPHYIEPSVDVEPRFFGPSWQTPVDVRFEIEPAIEHDVAFFATGGTALGATGNLAVGATIYATGYTTLTTLHAIEFERGKSLATAIAYGKVELTTSSGARQLATIRLEPLTGFAQTKVDVVPPPGFVASTVDVRIAFTPTSETLLATIPVGVATRLPVVPNAGFTYRVRALANGAVSDSGEVPFDLAAQSTVAVLPKVPLLVAPADDASIGAGEALVTKGAGVIEHLLVPEAGGPTIHVIVDDDQTGLPDLRSVGVTTTGAHAWSVRTYPTIQHVDQLSSLDARRYKPAGISAPRRINLR